MPEAAESYSYERAPNPKGRGSTDKVEKYNWKMLDQPGVPFLARKRDLHIDTTYQRTMVSVTRVQQIRQAWSWLACGSILVAERDGKFWVIDGQHRVLAAQERSDIDELPCLVFKSNSPEEEALAFYRANCVRGNVTAFDKLRAQLCANDQLAQDAVHLMESMNYKPSSNNDSPDTVRCISTFMSAMKSHRGALIKVWPLICRLHNRMQIKKTVFDALLYIARFGTSDITDREWEKRVLKAGLHKISEEIDRAASLYARGGAKVYAIATVEVINRGVRANQRMAIDESNAEEMEEAAEA